MLAVGDSGKGVELFMASNKTFLIVERSNRFRRHSAPSTPCAFSEQPPQDYWHRKRRVSVWDFSLVLEDASESCSSQEVDTTHSPMGSDQVSRSGSSSSGSGRTYVAILPSFNGSDPNPRWNVYAGWFLCKGFLLSQVVAGCLSVIIVSNETFTVVGIEHNLPFYMFLTAIWTTKLAVRCGSRSLLEKAKCAGFRYFCLSVLHAEINYLLLSALPRNSWFGNQAIDCAAAVSSLCIAYVLLEVRLHAVHISGFLLVLFANFLFSLVRIHSLGTEFSDKNGAGDILRITCGICLAYDSLSQEVIIKATDSVEYLGMIALTGMLVCAFQAMVLRTSEMAVQVDGEWRTLLIYSVAQFCLHSLKAKMVRDIGAIGFHLTLSSAAFYSHCLRVVLGYEQALYIVPYAAATIGSFLFTTRKAPIGTMDCFPIKTVSMT